MRAGEKVKISSLLPTCERISMDNYAEVRKFIEEDARGIVEKKYGAIPRGVAIVSLSFLHETVEAPSLTLLHGDVDEE